MLYGLTEMYSIISFICSMVMASDFSITYSHPAPPQVSFWKNSKQVLQMLINRCNSLHRPHFITRVPPTVIITYTLIPPMGDTLTGITTYLLKHTDIN